MRDNDLQPNHPGGPDEKNGQAEENIQQQNAQEAAADTERERMETLNTESGEAGAEDDARTADEQQSISADGLRDSGELDLSKEDEKIGLMIPDDQPSQEESAPSGGGGNGSKGWMIASLVLAAALIVVLIVPPFAKGSGNEAVANVNGVSITKDRLYDAMVEAGGTQMLDGIIREELIDQEMSKKSLTVTDEEVTAEVAALKASYPSEDQFNMALMQANLTEEDLSKQMREQVKLKKLLGDKVKVTDEEVKEIYDQYKESFATPEQVRASHILVETKEEADKIYKELQEGADFAAIAKEKNQDATKDTGGDLNFFGRGEMDPAFEEAAFKLKKGEISQPVKSSFGYHIIKLTDRKEATNPTYEEKKEEIRGQLVNQKVSQESPAYIQELKDKAKITNTLDKSSADAEGKDTAGDDTAATPAE